LTSDKHQADLVFETKVKNYIYYELNTMGFDDLVLRIKQFSDNHIFVLRLQAGSGTLVTTMPPGLIFERERIDSGYYVMYNEDTLK